MRRVRSTGSKRQSQIPAPSDDGTLATPAIASTTVAMIQALIPLGLKAVEDALQQEVQELAGIRYARDEESTGIARWGSQKGPIFLADQKLKDRCTESARRRDDSAPRDAAS